MSYKYKVRIVFFFKISSDQSFLLRFQIIWVADLAVIFLSNKLFGLVKTYRRDLVDFRKLDFEDLKFLSIVFPQKLNCILKKSCFHCHDLFKTVNISHLKVKTGVFIQMTLGIVFLCTEYRPCLKHSVKHTDHHLFVELWALCKHCRFVEVAEFKKVRSTLGSSCSDLRCMDLCKSFFIKVITESTGKSFLNLEFGSFLNVTECDRTQIQFCLQRCV